MDGFAVRAADTPGELPVAFRVAAGIAAARPAPDGTRRRASRPAAPCPTAPTRSSRSRSSRTAAIVVDRSGRGERRPARPAARRRRPRRRRRRRAGTRLGAAQIGALAAAGVAKVVCSARPRVAVLATGSELRPPARRSRRGRSTSRTARWSPPLSQRAGAEVDVLPVVADDEEAHREAIAARSRGGRARHLRAASRWASTISSAGSRPSSACEEIFWGVAVKPGKPLSFGVRERDARVRPAGEPGVVARRGARLRRARAPGASGATREPSALRDGRLGDRVSPEPAPGRVRARASASTTARRALLEADRRPGVAHDRRARPSRTRSSTCRAARARSRRRSSSASSRSTSERARRTRRIGPAAAARLRPHRARSARARARRPVPRLQPRRARGAPSRAGDSRR